MNKEFKIGLTAIAALMVLFFGIKFLKGISLFSSQDSYYLQFKDVKGLNESSVVYADGYKVGIVKDISYDFNKPGIVIVQIRTRTDLRIPKGSTVCIDEGMLGGCTLNMRLVPNSEAFQPGDTLIGTESSGLMSKAGDLMPKVDGILAKVDTFMTSLNALASNPDLPQIMHNAEQMTANLNQSSAELKKLIGEDVPQLTKTYGKVGENIVAITDNVKQINLQQTLDSINVAIGSANAAIASASHMIEQLQSSEGTLGKLMNDQELYNNLNHTVQSADSLVTDLKAHPKRYVHFSIFGRKGN